MTSAAPVAPPPGGEGVKALWTKSKQKLIFVTGWLPLELGSDSTVCDNKLPNPVTHLAQAGLQLVDEVQEVPLLQQQGVVSLVGGAEWDWVRSSSLLTSSWQNSAPGLSLLCWILVWQVARGPCLAITACIQVLAVYKGVSSVYRC